MQALILTIEELGIFKITQKPLEGIMYKKMAVQNNWTATTHYN